TKSVLVLRDLDVLEALAHPDTGPGATAAISIPFWSADDARLMEPFAAPPEARFRALEKLSAIGVRTGVSVSPIIPGWNDADIPKILKRAAECGASFAFYTLLRLPGAVEPVFLERLRRDFPERAGKVEHHMRETHGGELKHVGFGDRMRGTGKMADLIADLFRLHVRKNGLDRGEPGNMRVPRKKRVQEVRENSAATQRPRRQERIKKIDLQTDLF